MRRACSFLPLLFAIFLVIPLHSSCFAGGENEENKELKPAATAAINLGADLVSRYIWRGRDYGNSPAIQPNFSFTAGGFKIGAWGSYGFAPYSEKINDSTTAAMGNYAEFDPYISYTWKGFTLMVTDYFFPNPLSPNTGNKYFNYKNSTTGHIIEASICYSGPAGFPLQVTAGTMVFGADKGKDSLGVYGKGSSNNYSTYIEAAFQFTVKGIGLKPFIGGIPFGSSTYGPYGGIINAGFTASRSIPVTREYSLPVFTSIITNPQAQSIFFVFGISL
jgi:hypothetical protein